MHLARGCVAFPAYRGERHGESEGNSRGYGGSALEDYLGYHLRRASILDMADFVRHFADARSKPVPFRRALPDRRDTGDHRRRIGRKAALQRANLAPLLAEFEERGLIERHPDRQDHRIQRLQLSPREVPRSPSGGRGCCFARSGRSAT